MTEFTASPRVRTLAMAALVTANAITVSSLYWMQAVIAQTDAELGHSAILAMAPGAALLGYAFGVAGLACFSRDLSRPGGLAGHGIFLAAALCCLAVSPNPECVVLAALAVGAGCALTQRILVGATTLVGEAQRAQAIGFIIASGLLGIVFARAWVADAAIVIGWRALFVVGAAATGSACLVAAWVNPTSNAAPVVRPPMPSPLTLFRTVGALRSAAAQQALAFAVFHMGWALFPAATHASTTIRAAIASAGAVAAVVSGRACRTLSPRIVALTGLSTVGVALAAAALTFSTSAQASRSALLVAMSLVEVGTQIALVANQARAQAAAPSLPIRGRLAAIMTTIAFGGGAAGAAIGNLLQQ